MKRCNIIFKKMSVDDLKILHQWFQIPHILRWYARGTKYTFKMIKEKYLPRINDTSIPNFIICDQNKPIGYIQYYHLTDHLPEGVADYSHPLFKDFKPNEIVGIDLFIADENYLHVGLGSAILEAFIKMHINMFKAILVDPLQQNTKAISFFERNGFKHIMNQNSNHDLMLLTSLVKTAKSEV